jgi:hypothetical protein
MSMQNAFLFPIEPFCPSLELQLSHRMHLTPALLFSLSIGTPDTVFFHTEMFFTISAFPNLRNYFVQFFSGAFYDK